MKQAKFLILMASATLLAGCYWPVENGSGRETPLHFGLYVTPDPQTNPIDPPERFTGWHAGVDFEVSTSEADAQIDVYAVCSGKVRFGGFAEGYGGLLIQDCTLKGQPVTVLYGHLTVEGLPAADSMLTQGQRFATLGAARSRDTDGNRKHLHFEIHKGRDLVLQGYVQKEAELENFIDPMTVLPWPNEK